MNAKLLFGLIFAAGVFAGPAHAQRQPVPIVNYPDLPVATSSGRPLPAEQVKEAIQAAARTKGWTLAYEPGDKIVATLVVRNKHTVIVEIAYSGERYSLMYRDSVNMKYSPGTDRPKAYDLSSSMRGYRQPAGQVIHPFYNDWVRELKDAIRLELLKA
jgi:hypothetical protein